MIPYSTQSINEADIRAVAKTLRSPWLTQGPAVERFEKALAKKAGAKYAIALNSGTAALHAAYVAAGITNGDEVIVSAITFAATANAALFCGAKPVFADIEPSLGTMDVADAEGKITKRTKAIVPVDYGGRPVDYAKCRALCRRKGLIFIADAAQSLGARYRGKPVGSIADMTIFSFHPVKSITTGEGGAVVTNNKKYADTVRMFRTHGMSRDHAAFKEKNEGPWYQEMRMLGYNYRMPDILAALGESQLKRVSGFIAKRRSIAKRYQRLLARVPGLILPPAERGYEYSAWHLYPIRIKDPKRRKKVFSALRKADIGVQVHHIPVYRHVYYQKLGYKKGICPNAEHFYATEISIPIFPRLTEKEQAFVVRTLTAALRA